MFCLMVVIAYSEPELNEIQLTLCLQALNSLIGCKKYFAFKKINQLFTIQDKLFALKISLKTLLANSALFAQCLLQMEKVSPKDLVCPCLFQFLTAAKFI